MAAPYMKLYWGDYHRDTHHLNRSEHGAYLMLISALWGNGGKLPDDDLILARHALCTAEEWAQIKPVIMAFFKVSRGRVTHKRVTEEMAKYDDTIRKRKEAGKRGSNVTNGKIKGIGAANAGHLPTKPEPEPEPEDIEEPKGSPISRAAIPIPEGFPARTDVEEARRTVAEAGVTLDTEEQARRFRAHATTSDRRVKNWPAAWVSWIEREIAGAPQAFKPRQTGKPDRPDDWHGPAEVWQRVTASSPSLAGYLLRCVWSDEGRTLTTQSPTIHDRISRDAGHILRGLGVSLVLEARRAA